MSTYTRIWIVIVAPATLPRDTSRFWWFVSKARAAAQFKKLVVKHHGFHGENIIRLVPLMIPTSYDDEKTTRLLEEKTILLLDILPALSQIIPVGVEPDARPQGGTVYDLFDKEELENHLDNLNQHEDW